MSNQLIDNSELTLEQIPEIDAVEEVIAKFALTFNGYFYTGNMEETGQRYREIKDEFLDKGTISGTLSEFRSALFWEQRQTRWDGRSMDMEFARALIKQIRLAASNKSS